MIRSRLGLLGLCAVVFGLMAFAAGGAQAEPGAKWLILNSKGEHVELLAAIAVVEVEKKTRTLLAEIRKIKTEILCTGAKLIGVWLEPGGGLTNGGKVQFSGCIVILNGTLNKNCQPKAGGGAVGTIITNAFKGLILLHKLASGVLDDLVEIEPSVGETFVTINMGAACPIAENIPVRGKLFLKDCEDLFLKHLVKHLIIEGPLTHLWLLNLTAEHAAKIDGTGWVALTGAHEGLRWAGDPA